MQLQDIEFSPCSVGYFDNKFRKNTKDEIYLCCDKKCDNYREECDKLCKENQENYNGSLKDCLFSCNIMGNVCNKICESARFVWDQKYFDKCLQESGCLKNDFLNNQCLIEKKNDLITCCLKNCIPKKDLNCPQHCGISYDINLERSAPFHKDKIFNEAHPVYNNNNNYFWVYISISLVLLIIILILYKKKWLKFS